MGQYTDLTWHGAAIIEEMREHAGDGIDDGTEMLLAAARAIVPYDEGPLSESGRASRDGLTGLVSFDQPYAVIQHEELDYRHAPGRQAKYLEGPFNALQAQMIQAIADRLRAWMSS